MKLDQETLEDNLYKYTPEFNEIAFIKKIGVLSAKDTLRTLTEKALQLWFLWQEQKLTTAERSVVIGALGYLIVVTDIIPDNLLGGYCDDLLIINYALQLLERKLTPEILRKAGLYAGKYFPK